MIRIPLDVVEMVVDILRSQDDPELSSTKACSLACSDFLFICRKRIFAHVVVNQRNSHHTPPPKFGWQHWATTRTFQELLTNSPEIVDHIRSLDYRLETNDLTDLAVPGQILKKMTRLKSFTFRCFGFEWNNNLLRPALLHVLRLPTLIDFYVDGIMGFVLKDLELCHLEELGFDALEISGSHLDLPTSPLKLQHLDIGPFSPSAVIDMCGLNGQPLIDFIAVEEISIHSFSSDDLDASLYLLTHCKRITSLRFYNADGWTPELSFSDLSVLLIPMASRTLKYLEVHTIYEAEFSQDVYHGLSYELMRMADHNVLEDIRIDITIQMMSDCDRGDQWGTLDRALASGYPHLRRCSLTVLFFGASPVVRGLEEALLHVRQSQFPRLSSRNSLAFEFLFQDGSATVETI